MKLLRPLLLPLDDLDLAELLDRRVQGVGQQISNVLQLPDLLADEHSTSPGMIRAAVIQCAEALEQVDLAATLNVAPPAAAGRRICVVDRAGDWLLRPVAGHGQLVGTPLAGRFDGPLAATYVSRRGGPGGRQSAAGTAGRDVAGADRRPSQVPRVRRLLAGARARRAAGRRADCSRRPAANQRSARTSEHQLPIPDGTRRSGNAAQFGEANFRYELPALADPVDLYITGGDDWLGPIHIEPIDRPTVRTLELTARRPGGTADETQQIGDASAQLLYLPQTQLQLELVASEPLSSAEVLDKGLPLAGWTRVDERTYTVNWTMSESLALEFRLTGQRGSLTSKPYFLTIGLLKDREPRVTIRSSGVGRRVTPVARIPLSIRVNDDFGIASLALDWERTAMRDEKSQVDTKHIELEGPPPPDSGAEPRTEINLDHEMNLREQGLAPGNTLKLRGAATDACALGSQAGISRWLSFQIVAPDELFYEILMRQREQRAKFSAALESTKAQAKALVEVKKGDEVFGLSRAQQVIARAVFQVANQLDASLEEMTLNDLGTPQARETLQTAIIGPLRTLHGDLLAKLRTSIDGLGQQETIAEDRRAEAIALADQSVETMQAILAQMSLWESFIDVINQLKQVIDRQGQVLKSTEEQEKQRTEDLFDK